MEKPLPSWGTWSPTTCWSIWRTCSSCSRGVLGALSEVGSERDREDRQSVVRLRKDRTHADEAVVHGAEPHRLHRDARLVESPREVLPFVPEDVRMRRQYEGRGQAREALRPQGGDLRIVALPRLGQIAFPEPLHVRAGQAVARRELAVGVPADAT